MRSPTRTRGSSRAAPAAAFPCWQNYLRTLPLAPPPIVEPGKDLPNSVSAGTVLCYWFSSFPNTTCTLAQDPGCQPSVGGRLCGCQAPRHYVLGGPGEYHVTCVSGHRPRRSSGRAIVGTLDGSPLRLRLEEVHRFEHVPCPTPAGPVWDLTGIWREILTGLGQAAEWCRENKAELKSVGVDTWGVDWTLVGPSGELLSLAHCYRDPQNDAACQDVLERIGGFERLYERTGIQLLVFNTIFQLAARHRAEPKLFDAASRLVFLPDLFHFWLSGQIATERTIASTSSMLAVQTGQWDTELVAGLGLPTDILGQIVEPGTVLGGLREEVAETTGASPAVQVVAPASHDTASAVAAVPAADAADWAYLSSGTWSLLGAELDKPIVTELARAVPFTNERGVSGTIRFLKNIAGLWLVQEVRRELSSKATSEVCRLDRTKPAAPSTAGPSSIRITLHSPFPATCKPSCGSSPVRRVNRNRRRSARSSAAVWRAWRCAMPTRWSSWNPPLAGRWKRLHIVGGGAKNALLNELTAAAVGKPVIVGPIEATAIGNLLVQAEGDGQLAGLAEIRQVVANSFPLDTYKPKPDASWVPLRARFNGLCANRD